VLKCKLLLHNKISATKTAFLVVSIPLLVLVSGLFMSRLFCSLRGALGGLIDSLARRPSRLRRCDCGSYSHLPTPTSHLPQPTLYSALHSAPAMAKRAHGAAFATSIPDAMFVSAGGGLDAPEPQVCSQSRSSMPSRAHPPTDAVSLPTLLPQLPFRHARPVATRCQLL
jgi:hypothetical protein